MELPKLPSGEKFDDVYGEECYTTDQMQEYARQAVLMEREQCAKVCEEAHELMNSSFQGAAEAIRART